MLRSKSYVWDYTHNMVLPAISFPSIYFFMFFSFLNDDKCLLGLIYIKVPFCS